MAVAIDRGPAPVTRPAAPATPEGNVRAVVAMPVLNEERHIVEALESLTAQTDPRLRILVMDNSSADRTNDLASAVARRDPRVTVERTSRRLGSVDNWLHAYHRARELHPAAPYLAWAGGHDLWHPRWLETLALELDTRPETAGAFPRGVEIDAHGRTLGPAVARGGTTGMRLARERAARRLPGGTLHGLFRTEALEHTGPFRRVLLPDLLFLAEMAAVGGLEEVPETLWFQRAKSSGPALARSRQTATVFGGRVPAHAHLPWPLVHAGLLLWALGLRGNGVLPRRQAPAVAHAYYRVYSYTIAWRWRQRVRLGAKALRKSRGGLRRRRRRALRTAGRLWRRGRKVSRRVVKAKRRLVRRVGGLRSDRAG